jgi:hypothetical protein
LAQDDELVCLGTAIAEGELGGKMIRSFVSLGSIALALAACGGSVTPDTPSSGSTTGGATTSSTGSSGTTGTTTGGDTVGTSGGSGTGTSDTVTVGTSGSTGSTVSTSSTGPSTVAVGTTGSTTTGTCGAAGSGGAGGAGGASGAEDGGVSDASVSHYTIPLHEVSGEAPPVRVAPPGSAMLLRYGDFPPIGTTTTGTSGSTGVTTGSGPDPNTQYLVFGDAPVSCGMPYGPGTCGHWRVLIGIPPNDFKVGLISLDCANVNSFFSATGPDRGGGDCSGGGGSFNHGWLDIIKIDADGADVRLSGTWTFDFDANASYRAPRCIK